LTPLQATADFERASALFNELSSVDANMLELRKEVIERYEARKVLVQCNVFEDGGHVSIRNYPATAEGMIESFVDRYVRNKELSHLMK